MMVIRRDKEINEYRERQSRTLRFVRTHELPPEILRTMQSYLRQQLADGDGAAPNALLATLPPTLSSRIKNALYKDTLASMPLLRSTSEPFLAKLSARLVMTTMNENVEILSAGEVAKNLLLIMTGSVALRDPSSDAGDGGEGAADGPWDGEGSGAGGWRLRSAPAAVGFASFVASWCTVP